MTERKTVTVALSGGVDSTLTARLLLDAGYGVSAATMLLFDGQDTESAAAMADFLGIPHKVFDLRESFRDTVIRDFIGAYAKGVTPNPCMICDFHIKFGAFYEAALAHFGADFFATTRRKTSPI